MILTDDNLLTGIPAAGGTLVLLTLLLDWVLATWPHPVGCAPKRKLKGRWSSKAIH